MTSYDGRSPAGQESSAPDDQYMRNAGDRNDRPSRRDSNEQKNNTIEDNDGCTLYLSNLSSKAAIEEIQKLFEPSPEDANIICDPSGVSRGFGFVRFRTAEEATQALKCKDSFVLNGRRLMVAPAKRKFAHEPTPGYYKGPLSTHARYDNRSKHGSTRWRGNTDGDARYSRDHRYPSRNRDYGDDRNDRYYKSDRFDHERDRYERSDKVDSKYSRPYDSRHDERRGPPRDRDSRYDHRYCSPGQESRNDTYNRRNDRERRGSRDAVQTTRDFKGDREHPYDRKRSQDRFESRDYDYRRSPRSSRGAPHNYERHRRHDSYNRSFSPRHRR